MQKDKNTEKKWCVYMLECCDGSLYTGITNDLAQRMRMHASGKGSKYVSSKGFKQLLVSKECLNKSHASACEYAIKQLPKNQKYRQFG